MSDLGIMKRNAERLGYLDTPSAIYDMHEHGMPIDGIAAVLGVNLPSICDYIRHHCCTDPELGGIAIPAEILAAERSYIKAIAEKHAREEAERSRAREAFEIVACAACGGQWKRFRLGRQGELCDDCYQDERIQAEAKRLKRQLRRVSKRELPATLTLSEWLRILGQHGWQCAICHGMHGPFDAMDHIRPVCSGGGTTADNVRPACQWCNRHQGGRTMGGLKRAQAAAR